jgi:glycerate kinase
MSMAMTGGSKPMRIVVAPQEFKGTLTAQEAAQAMAEGARRALPDAGIDEIPMSDGGPGLVQALISATGGHTIRTNVQDPLGRPVVAEWGLLEDGSAVIEMAAAAGLWRLGDGERDARVTTTYGVGELIRAALDAGCTRLIVGLGGSATNDGGAGMAAALGARFFDSDGHDLPPGGAMLRRLARIDISRLDSRLAQCEIVAAADVTNPLCGPKGASLVYGPQKGASADTARELDAALRHYASIVERDLGVSVLDASGAGAAGGLGAGMIGFLRAHLRPGIDVVAEAVRLQERLQGADLVLTGEGRLDGQTGYGKTVSGLARLGRECAVPVIVIAGALGDGWEDLLPLVNVMEPVVGDATTLEEALARPAETLAATVERAVRGWLLGR